MRNWYKNQKGSMAVYVAVSILSFMVILTGIFFMSASVRKNQLKTIPKIKEAYEKDLGKEQDIYNVQEALRSLEGGNFNIDKGVNTPKLGTGMTPIKWDASAKDGAGDWIETTTKDNQWYSYGTTEDTRKWANAKTADGSMWVWIPRYAYQIDNNYHTTSVTGGTINIKFMKGTTLETSDGTAIVEYNETTTEGYTKFPDGYVIHPGFEYDRTVPGIWVAKFEASHTGCTTDLATGQTGASIDTLTLQVKPGVTSWRNISINDIYIKCLEYNSKLNSHMMKNTEWGAVAYLAQSTYGKNSEIWSNNSSSFITGLAGNDSSTTGTIYGIYDMSGGTHEYTAAYINNGNDNLNNYGASLLTGASYTKNQYIVEQTEGAQSNYELSSERYADAIYETSNGSSGMTSWYENRSIYPYDTSPFFHRGGYYNDEDVGSFGFSRYSGIDSKSIGFRPVLIIRRRNRANKRNRIT